jgi:glycolate oxidase
VEVRIIRDVDEAKKYWNARASLYPLALTMAKRLIAEDVTVPRDRIPEFVRGIESIAASTGILIGIGGHAGDGNMHPSIFLGDDLEETKKKAGEAVARIVETGLALGGTISGEHGIGLHKSEFIEWELGRDQVELMKRIKSAFDPHGIMNPGKIWPDSGTRKK